MNDQIISLNELKTVSEISWLERGRSPRGYSKGMALSYARIYGKFLDEMESALVLARENSLDSRYDALAVFEGEFGRLGLDVNIGGIEAIRNTFTLLYGLGMRESSGRHCLGRYLSDPYDEAHSAEAGLFQTAWSASAKVVDRRWTPINPMRDLFREYEASSDPGFLEVFSEGVSCDVRHSDIWGDPDTIGGRYQHLAKNSPSFAVEFSAIGIREKCQHWGPIKKFPYENFVEIRREVYTLCKAVESVIEETGYRV